MFINTFFIQGGRGDRLLALSKLRPWWSYIQPQEIAREIITDILAIKILFYSSNLIMFFFFKNYTLSIFRIISNDKNILYSRKTNEKRLNYLTPEK